MSKTLYVTDLDGTLMRNDKSISAKSIELLNRLLAEGASITYATARSLKSASEVTQNLHLSLPVVIRNGTILADPQTKKEIEITTFELDALYAIRQILQRYKLSGFVTSYIDGKEIRHYLKDNMNEGFRQYVTDHSDDERLRAVQSEQELYEGNVCYFTFIDKPEELDVVADQLNQSKEWTCIYQQDKYSSDYWLEICPKDASKASAIQKIMRRYDYDTLIVFGDSLNDLSMFEVADEAYAVENAMDEVKAKATAVILSNEDDGVAQWIENDFRK